MRAEDQIEDEAPDDAPGRLARWRRALAGALLALIDAASRLLLRFRERVEPPAAADGPDDRRRKPHEEQEALPEVIALSPKPRRLLRFLLFIMALTMTTIAAATFSYRLLSRSIDSNSIIIETLRDEVAQLKKQGARDEKLIAGHREVLRDYDDRIARQLRELDDYRAQVDELHSRVEVVRGARRESAIQDRHGRPPVAATAPQAPKQAEPCTMDPKNVGGSLVQCVEEFNRH